MKKIGFIDYYLHEWHADNMPAWILEASNGEMKVCYAWGEIDSPLDGGLTNKAWAEKMDIELCATQEEVIEKSDYLVVLSPDNPERHVDLCKSALTSGKPTFVDKTFAVGLEDAKQIVENAKDTPYFTCSALRYDTELQTIKKTDIEAINCRGPGLFDIYTIHMLEPLYMMMGKAKRVLALGSDSAPTLLYDYTDGCNAVLSFFDYEVGFSTAIRYTDGSCANLLFNSEYFKAFAADLVKFFKTGVPPVSIEDTLDIMAMIDAGRKAVSNPGVWTKI
ncbi:MAG: Gfo/Idh/MocA family oxidoreductase [Oscillospiraceae bacterium]|jgi:predicted dehydrogenase|nr:Gfo/Idh/MocA family oxidoreductase [Oscillospiraceae bacterium]